MCVYHAGYNRTTIVQDVEGGEDKNAECAYGCVTQCMHLCVRLCVCVCERARVRARVCVLALCVFDDERGEVVPIISKGYLT